VRGSRDEDRILIVASFLLHFEVGQDLVLLAMEVVVLLIRLFWIVEHLLIKRLRLLLALFFGWLSGGVLILSVVLISLWQGIFLVVLHNIKEFGSGLRQTDHDVVWVHDEVAILLLLLLVCLGFIILCFFRRLWTDAFLFHHVSGVKGDDVNLSALPRLTNLLHMHYVAELLGHFLVQLGHV